MIFTEIAAGQQMLLGGWLHFEGGTSIKLPQEQDVVDFCPCTVICDYVENAWVYPADATNSYKNDYRAVLVTLLDATSTYLFQLIDESGNEYDLLDDTYGELFDVGFNTVQPLKAGYRIDWLKVYTVLGLGNYKIKVSQTDFSYTVESLSHKFNVRVFNEMASDKSVKIETVQSGMILNGEDYGGMEWRNMVRVWGKFGAASPTYEIDRLVDANRSDIDIQTTKFNKYTLSTELLPDFIGDVLTDDAVMTDQIFISVNDVWNYKQYRRLAVTFEGSLEPGEDYAQNNRKLFSVTFKDKKQKVKRNFV